MKTKKPVILIIRDGWGYREEKENNLIAAAKTPFNDFLMEKYPLALLKADGEAVGLEPGYQGNSEVGHLTIGTGRIIYQPLNRIQNSIRNGSFFSIPEFLEIIEYCRKNSSTLHLLGLLQKEGVHSHLDHLFALLDLCKKKNFQNVVIHAITDGRDAPVQKGIDYLKELENKLSNLGFGIIATLAGRYYAMDRDCRWERTKLYYDSLVSGIGTSIVDIPPSAALNTCYQKGETDEFIKPLVFSGYSGVKDSDGIIFFNFRTDRTRQITKALVEKDFDAWARPRVNIHFVAMTQYYTPMNAAVAFVDQKLNNTLGEAISEAGYQQLRLSETEKYAHVTFFFNGQQESAYKGEERILISSPKVATYDLQPEMSAREIATTAVEKIKTKAYDFIVINLVNCDMVGHSGNPTAIKIAVETVDQATEKICTAGQKEGYDIIITADHGNAEEKIGQTQTSHTTNPVPLFYIPASTPYGQLAARGGLCDVAPSILDLMSLHIPSEMTGKTLFHR